jgi:hypothetical protein
LGLFSAGTLGSMTAVGGLVVVPKRMTYFPTEAFLPQSDVEVYLNHSSGSLSSPIPVERARFSVAESDINSVFREMTEGADGRYFVFSNPGEARIRVEYDGRSSLYTVRVLDPSGGSGNTGSGTSGTGGTGGGIVIVGP